MDLNPQQFSIDKSQGSALSEHEHANRVNRIVSTYNASTPQQQHEGNLWYRHANRAAVTVAKGENPGIGLHTKAMKRGIYRPPGITDEHVERAAGAIARLSPSMPAGMDWEHNAQAAHEVGKLSGKQVQAVNRNQEGARYVKGNSSMHHAGGQAIVHAHAILKGEVSAEADLNEKAGKRGVIDVRKKAGSFKRNIANPMHSNEVTIDARSAGVAAGKRVGFEDVALQVGNMQGARYKDYEHAYQEATHIVNQHLAQAGKPALQPHQVQATTWVADKQDLEGKINPSGTSGGHLHSGAGGKAASHRDFPTPAGQERSNSA